MKSDKIKSIILFIISGLLFLVIVFFLYQALQSSEFGYQFLTLGLFVIFVMAFTIAFGLEYYFEYKKITWKKAVKKLIGL